MTREEVIDKLKEYIEDHEKWREAAAHDGDLDSFLKFTYSIAAYQTALTLVEKIDEK